jgi:ATP-dependent exoDNAse (exonuclease V) beta subunit
LQFNRFLPYRTFTTRADIAEQLGDACLYVQGSLDLLLEHSDGSLTLCDYKTDRLRTESWGKDLPQAQRRDAIRQQLVLDHGEQLRIYADAVLGMFGKYPDRILIYSLPLGTEVDMTDLILCPHPLRAK